MARMGFAPASKVSVAVPAPLVRGLKPVAGMRLHTSKQGGRSTRPARQGIETRMTLRPSAAATSRSQYPPRSSGD